MSNNLSEWTTLLDGHEARLQMLSAVLAEEKSALLANDLGKLHDAINRKIAATAAVDSSQQSIIKLLKNSEGSPTGLKSLIDSLPTEMKKILRPKREKIKGLARRISRLNAFNADCLATYSDHVSRLNRMFTALIGSKLTYNADGKSPDDPAGKLINRSL